MKKKSRNILIAGVTALLVAGAAGYAAYSYTATPDKQATKKKTVKKSVASETKSSGEDTGTSTGQSSAAKTETYENQRYGFKFGYPAGWQVERSANGDGATFTDPSDDSVTVKAYGYPTAVFSLADVVNQRESLYKNQYPDIKRLEKKDITVDDHPAAEVVWTYGNAKNKSIFTIKGEAVITLEWVTPADKYETYGSASDASIASIKLK